MLLKVVLTGATGFLGYRTLEKLVEAENVASVIATGRNLKVSHQVIHPKVKYILGDLEDETFAMKLTTNADIIINAAALSSPWGKEEEFIRANVNTQKNLLKASIQNAISRFVYISTPGVYFTSKDRLLIKESDPLPDKFINAYARTKRAAEIILEQSGLEYVILRPRALIGRGDTVIMPRLIRAVDEGKLRIIGNGLNRVDMTSVGNVADAILLSMTVDKNGINQTYNISNGDPVLLWDCIEKVLRMVGKEMPSGKISYPLAIAVAQMMEWKSKISNFNEPPLTKYGIGTLGKSFSMDITKARNLLKYEPRVTTMEAMEEFAKWHLQK